MTHSRPWWAFYSESRCKDRLDVDDPIVTSIKRHGKVRAMHARMRTRMSAQEMRAANGTRYHEMYVKESE